MRCRRRSRNYLDDVLLVDAPCHPVDQAHSPYLVQEADEYRFFDRNTLIADLVEKTKQTLFLAVLGPSTSGKSSVVCAELIPMIKEGTLPGTSTESTARH